MEKYHVLVVEDDKEIRDGIEIYLKSQGYEVFKAADGIEGLEIIYREEIHLAIVDVMMPRKDGIQMVMEMRKDYDFPVTMLSAKSEEVDKILGLNMGADDYVAKPYNPQELAARVKSHLRRYTSLGDIHKADDDGCITNGRLEFHTNERVLYVDKEPVRLTATETKIMELLMKYPGRVFPAEEIYERVWNEQGYACENTVMVHIRRIREKIELNPKEPEYLKVVWGIGYKIEKMEK